MADVSWKQARKTPGLLALRAKPNLSESVLADPERDKRRETVDLLNILSGIPGAEIALAKGLGGLGAMAGILKPKPRYEMFHSDMPLGAYAGGKELTTPLFVSPSSSDFKEIMKSSIEGSRSYGEPTVRMLKDLKTGKVYAWDGNEALHADTRTHLGLKPEDVAETKYFRGEDPSEFMKRLEEAIKPGNYAHGGQVTTPETKNLPPTTHSGYNWNILAEEAA